MQQLLLTLCWAQASEDAPACSCCQACTNPICVFLGFSLAVFERLENARARRHECVVSVCESVDDCSTGK